MNDGLEIMHLFRIMVWLIVALVVVFEMITMFLAWNKRRLSAIFLLGMLAVQTLPPPIFIILNSTHPQPYHDVPLNMGIYGVALLFFIALLIVILVPLGAIITFVIFLDIRNIERRGPSR